MTNRGDATRLINQLFTDFGLVRTDDLFISSILYGRHANYLQTDLDDAGFKVQVPHPSPAAQRWAVDALDDIDDGIVMNVAVHNPRWRGRGDKMEVGASWVLNKLDPGNRTTMAIKRAMIGRPYAAVWECLRPFNPPTDKEEYDEYLASYFPMYLEVDAGRSSVFLEDQGIVTLACRKILKTVYEIARDYNKRPEEKDRNPLQIWGEDFPGLRVAFGLDEWTPEQRNGGRRITIYEIDDGNTRSHWVDAPLSGVNYNWEGTQNIGGELRPISNLEDDEPWPNPLGRPMFRFACGYFNPDAEYLYDRYQAFLKPVLKKAYQCDLERSMLDSYSASLPQRILELPKEVLDDLAEKPINERAEYIDTIMQRETQGVLKVIGTMKQLDMPVPQMLAEAIKLDIADLNALIPKQPLADQTMKEATATALAINQDYKKAQYSSPRKNFSRLIHDVIEDVFQLYRESDDSVFSNTPGASTYVQLMGLTTGKESPKGREVKPGEHIELGPKELGPDDSWYDLEVQYVDQSAQAEAARRAKAAELKSMGAIDTEQWLELLDFTNTTEQIKRLDIEAWKGTLKTPLTGIALTQAFRTVSIYTGIDAQTLIQAMNPQAPPPSPALGPPQNGNGQQPRQPYSVAPPSPNERPVGVTS